MYGLHRRVLLCLLLMSAALAVSSRPLLADDPKNVALTVDYGDGVQKRFTEIAWKDGMTIADLLEAAAKHPRGIKYVKRGEGATAFLTQIDDLKNGAMDKYWIYEVNGKRGDRSYALVKLKAGDAVLWSFDTYQ
jgi:hypothetical protein